MDSSGHCSSVRAIQSLYHTIPGTRPARVPGCMTPPDWISHPEIQSTRTWQAAADVRPVQNSRMFRIHEIFSQDSDTENQNKPHMILEKMKIIQNQWEFQYWISFTDLWDRWIPLRYDAYQSKRRKLSNWDDVIFNTIAPIQPGHIHGTELPLSTVRQSHCFGCRPPVSRNS